jgi:hypothetical protein
MTFASLRLGWPTNRFGEYFRIGFRTGRNVPKPRNRDLWMIPYRGLTSAFRAGIREDQVVKSKHYTQLGV